MYDLKVYVMRHTLPYIEESAIVKYVTFCSQNQNAFFFCHLDVMWGLGKDNIKIKAFQCVGN